MFRRKLAFSVESVRIQWNGSNLERENRAKNNNWECFTYCFNMYICIFIHCFWVNSVIFEDCRWHRPSFLYLSRMKKITPVSLSVFDNFDLKKITIFNRGLINVYKKISPSWENKLVLFNFSANCLVFYAVGYFWRKKIVNFEAKWLNFFRKPSIPL